MNDAVKKEQDMIATPLHAEETEDAIERHFAIDLLDVINEKIKNGEPFPYKAAKRFIEKIPAAQFKQPEPLTDIEQRIFLAAMSKEEKVCRLVEEECKDIDGINLMTVCREIERKVKGALWT